MNEVTQVHLGRQAFTISVDALRELRTYLDAIAKQVNDTDVSEEVELRMAELLTERGVIGEKVVLTADIAFLKQQLGEPTDFTEDQADDKSPARSTSDKRLFRDTQNGWLGGVSAGLAAYLGVETLLIRLLFIVGLFAGGGSILLYIILWLLVPEAKTSSERLQMAGKPITVDSLKEAVERADVKGAAMRAGDTLAGPAARIRDVINILFRLVVKLLGIGITLFGLLSLIGLAFGALYFLVHGNIVADNLFPVGIKEHLLVYLGSFVAVMAAVFIVLFGMAIYTRKWPIRLWLTGVLVGLSVLGAIGTGALAADTVPKVQDRYHAHLHTTVRQLQPFNTVNVYGDNITINFKTSDAYSASMTYFDNANTNAIKTEVQNGVLTVDSRNFKWQRDCSQACIPDTYDMVLTISSPSIPPVSYPDAQVKPVPAPPKP